MAVLTIEDAALEYLDLGFSVIPIRPGPEKKPYVAWTQFQKRRPTEEEVINWWKTWPQANVAIITGSISGIFVVDGDGEIGSRWITENLPKTSVYAKTGRAAGCHCFYRYPAGAKIPCKVGWKPKVDIRGEGGYVVAAPSIHHTGNRYTLILREGLRGWEELHEFNPYELPGEKTQGNLLLDLSKTKMPGEIFEPAKTGERNATMASLLGKVFRAGMTDEQAWEYINAWNAKNKPPMGEKEVKATFRSILKLHRQSAPISIEPEPIIEAIKPEPDQTDQAITGPVTDAYPIECLQPGGLLQEIMTYVEKSSSNHKPIFALSAAIALVGNLLGQRVMTETGLRTNMYCVSIGYSGCGKNASHSAISAILRGSEARASMGPTDTASGAAVLKWMTTDNHQVTLFTLDEIGMLLKGLKNPGSPMCELPRILTKIFSETDRPYSKSYADSKLNITIPWHHLSLYASSTPGQFWGHLTEADAVSGFLARLLIFEARDEASKPREAICPEVPKSLMEKANALWNIPTPIDPERGDIARVPVPFVIPRSMEAKVIFSAWADEYWRLRNIHRDDEAKSAVFGRAAEHAGKLSLIHAMSLHGAKAKEVLPESIQWATKTTDACINTLMRGIKEGISKNQFHAEQQKVIKIIQGLGGEARAREVYKRIHAPVRTANEIIASLVSAGEIKQENRPNKNNVMVTWLVISGDEK